jgi:hypothetical protein
MLRFCRYPNPATGRTSSSMKIQEKDIYHGAALTQIVEHPSFKALNRATEKYGHYLVNTDLHVFVKYRKSSRSPYIFTVQPDELNHLGSVISSNNKVFFCFVCGRETICALDKNEILTVLNLASLNQQSVRVEIPKGGSCHVSGTAGRLTRTVPHNSFPVKVFV